MCMLLTVQYLITVLHDAELNETNTKILELFKLKLMTVN